MADTKITDLPLGTDIDDNDEILYIDTSDNTAGPNGTDKRVLVGSLRNIANRNITTTDLINSNSSNIAVGTAITTTGFYANGDGGDGKWIKTADTGTPSQTPAQFGDTKFTDAQGNVFDLVLSGEINVAKLGAGYGSDDTSAFNLATKKLRDSMTTLLDFEYTTLTFVIPPKEYNVSSINFTGFRGARNLNILAWGAVIKPTEAGKKIIDATGSRWLWFWGLTISSEDFESEAGIQLGNEGTETCGNNKFFAVQCLGKFSRAPIANYGSETTQYYSCRMANNSVNVDSYAYIGDGANSLGYSSDYVNVTRSSPQAVSFTNNKFYGCQMRHTGLGQPMYLSGFRDWDIDSACYLLSPQGHAITLWGSSLIRSLSLGLNGLMETTGLEGIINFISDGTTNTLEALRLKTPSPHVSGTIFKNSTGTTVNILNGSIDINRQFNSDDSPVFFDPSIRFSGSIKTRYAAGLNLGDLIEFNGDLFCNDISAIASLPVSGGYSIRDEEGLSISTGVKYVGLEAWELKNVDAGVITVDQQLNTLNEASSVDVTDLAAGESQGYQEIYFRNGGATNITFKHNNSKLRNISGTDVIISTHQAISYIRVSSTVWQQVGGKV